VLIAPQSPILERSRTPLALVALARVEHDPQSCEEGFGMIERQGRHQQSGVAAVSHVSIVTSSSRSSRCENPCSVAGISLFPNSGK
jgi:hypothetical protein